MISRSGAATKKREWSWVLYDVGNSAFFTTIITGFFPIFFKSYWAKGVEVTKSSFYLGLTNTLAGLFIALLAPFVGALTDHFHIRTKMLGAFTFLGVACTVALYFIPLGGMGLALWVFAIANVGLATGASIYDSQLVDITSRERFHLISARGFSFGYLGGMVLFAFNVAMTLNPDWFGVSGKAEAVRFSFLSVALWWSLFSLPLLLNVPDEPKARPEGPALISAFVSLKGIVKDILRNRQLMLFLAAYWLYFDGIMTVIKMAIDYGMSIGFDSSDLIVALLVTQAVGFPATLVFGLLPKKIGVKKSLLLGIGVYVFVSVYSIFMSSTFDFYLLSIAIGLVQGGVQSISRSFFAGLIPPEQSTEYFGFYNMLGRFAAILGPGLMGGISYLTGNPRLSMLSLILLFAAGAFLLSKVDETMPSKEASL